MKGNSCDSCAKADECDDRDKVVLMDNAEIAIVESCSNYERKK